MINVASHTSNNEKIMTPAATTNNHDMVTVDKLAYGMTVLITSLTQYSSFHISYLNVYQAETAFI